MDKVRKAMFLTAPLNIRIPYQVMTADVLGTYLLIGTDKGLLACDLTSAAAPRGRLRVVVKDVVRLVQVSSSSFPCRFSCTDLLDNR